MKVKHSVNGTVAVWFVLLLGILIVFSCTSYLQVSATSSVEATMVDVMDLVIDIE